MTLDELLARYPAGDVAAIRGDLKALAGRYAKRGAEGDGEPWWRVWHAIRRERGLDLDQALAELNAEQRLRLALWSFEIGEDADGIQAYVLFLRDPFPFGADSEHNALFKAALARAGRAREIVTLVDEIQSLRASPGDQAAAVRVELREGRVAAARGRLEPVLARYHDLGDLWAVRALLEHQAGDEAAARRALLEAAKLDVEDEDLLADALSALRMSESEWRLLRRPFEPPDWDEHLRRCLRDPGARLVPSSEPSPHRHGGDPPLAMPACAGCGHPIRAWFTLDLAAIPALAALVPSWPVLPLAGCNDCMVWMGRHDYEIAADRLVLCNVAIDTEEYGTAHGEAGPLPAQFARLEPRAAIAAPSAADLDAIDDEEDPVVGGQPPWVQDPRRVFCPRCRQEMVYLAAMTTTSEFEHPVSINNESGFQYHFACAPCSVLSVIAQWT